MKIELLEDQAHPELLRYIKELSLEYADPDKLRKGFYTQFCAAESVVAQLYEEVVSFGVH